MVKNVSFACLMAVAAVASASLVRADKAGLAPLPVAISSTDPNLYYIGRADNRDPAGPRFAWSDSQVVVRFTGTNLQAKINEDGDDYFGVAVDNAAPTVVHPPKGESIVALASGLPAGDHTVTFFKRTEPSVGTVQFRGFYLNAGGKLDPPLRLARKVEVIGDSISCGYGNEASSEKVHFTAATENGALAYGAVAADRMGAEYHCVAWSGRKMWPDNTTPSIYDLALPGDLWSRWDLKSWVPDAVLINLATNDFGPGNPDELGWTSAYVAFVRRLRLVYPNAMIYLSSGTMMSDGWPPQQKSLTTLNGYLDKIHETLAAAGDKNIRVIHFGVQDSAADGLGADWHPSLKTDRKMADMWVKALQADLGWQPVK